VPFLIELARMNRTVIGQNITISVLTAIVGLALAASGTIEIFGALLFHFLGDVLVILNSFRLFRFGENYAEPISTDAPSAPARREASVTRLQPA
jgi:cation transport ATPase